MAFAPLGDFLLLASFLAGSVEGIFHFSCMTRRSYDGQHVFVCKDHEALFLILGNEKRNSIVRLMFVCIHSRKDALSWHSHLLITCCCQLFGRKCGVLVLASRWLVNPIVQGKGDFLTCFQDMIWVFVALALCWLLLILGMKSNARLYFLQSFKPSLWQELSLVQKLSMAHESSWLVVVIFLVGNVIFLCGMCLLGE